MKVMLIMPPIENKVKFFQGWQLNSSDYGLFPPLGLLYIATVLKRQLPEVEVKIVDCPSQGFGNIEVKEIVSNFRPDVVGMTTFSLCLVDVLGVAKTVKSIDQNIHVCLGGPHTSIYPAQTLEYPEIDSIVVGEGEYVFLELVKQLKEKKDFCSTIDGIYLKQDLKKKYFKKAVAVDLNELPFFDITLVDRKIYYSSIGRYRNIITLLSSRGCPYKCTFCDTPYKEFRSREVENIFQEIKLRLSQGYQEIFFYDDTFNINSKRITDLCELIIKDNVRFSWSFRGRVNNLTFDTLKIAKRSGCQRIHFGIETATNSGLEELRKMITVEQIKEVFYWCRKLKIKIVADFIIGLPFERSRKMVLENIMRLIKFSPDYAQFNILQPVPGSEIYSLGARRGVIDPNIWEDFVHCPNVNFEAPLWTEYLKKDELADLLYLAYRKFYLRPRFILRNLLSARTSSAVKRMFNGGLKIMFRN
jgi:anaerobic magnesium-protoporphyrin IX monomethyl ester cyclase